MADDNEMQAEIDRLRRIKALARELVTDGIGLIEGGDQSIYDGLKIIEHDDGSDPYHRLCAELDVEP